MVKQYVFDPRESEGYVFIAPDETIAKAFCDKHPQYDYAPSEFGF